MLEKDTSSVTEAFLRDRAISIIKEEKRQRGKLFKERYPWLEKKFIEELQMETSMGSDHRYIWKEDVPTFLSIIKLSHQTEDQGSCFVQRYKAIRVMNHINRERITLAIKIQHKPDKTRIEFFDLKQALKLKPDYVVKDYFRCLYVFHHGLFKNIQLKCERRHIGEVGQFIDEELEKAYSKWISIKDRFYKRKSAKKARESQEYRTMMEAIKKKKERRREKLKKYKDQKNKAWLAEQQVKLRAKLERIEQQLNK